MNQNIYTSQSTFVPSLAFGMFLFSRSSSFIVDVYGSDLQIFSKESYLYL